MQLAYGTVQRVRTLDHAIEPLGRRPVRKLDPPVLAALRLGAYQLAYLDVAAARGGERVGRARPRAPGSSARSRSRTRSCAASREGIRGLARLAPGDATPAEAALSHSYPDWVAETLWRELGRRGGARAHARAERAAADGRPSHRRAAPSSPASRIPTFRRAHGRADPRGVARRRARLAAEPRLAARRARRRRAARRADPRPLRRARRQGDAARRARGEVVAVEMHEGRARELEANAARLGADERHGRQRRRARASRRASTGFDRVLVDAPCSGSACSPRGPTCAGARDPLPELQRGAARGRGASASGPEARVTYAVCTINEAENEAVVDAVGLAFDDLGAEWPGFRHPRRPEFLLTLPHVHRTSGFFVARMRA